MVIFEVIKSNNHILRWQLNQSLKGKVPFISEMQNDRTVFQLKIDRQGQSRAAIFLLYLTLPITGD